MLTSRRCRRVVLNGEEAKSRDFLRWWVVWCLLGRVELSFVFLLVILRDMELDNTCPKFLVSTRLDKRRYFVSRRRIISALIRSL